jgi:iron complex outermembrane receptor protein
MAILLAANVATAETQAAGEATLQEIVVSARKTAENVQDVPLTVNVLTANALQNAGSGRLSVIGGLAPNIVWEDRGGSVRNRVSIRGISSNETNTGIDPGIGFYLDDVYISSGIGFNQSLLDIDRVEILKGPQGTLFGRNTTAGVISIHTRRPSQETYFEGELDSGNYDLQQARAVFNTPLSGTTALKLSGIYKKRDGYARNVVTGDRVNGEDQHGGRAQLLYRPNDSFDLLASFDFFRDDAAQNLAECQGGPVCRSGNNHDHVLEANEPNTTTRTMWSGALTANWQPQGTAWTLTSITAYRHMIANEDQDQDGTALDFNRSGFALPLDWQLTQELRLATDQKQRLRGVLGVYFLHEYRDSASPQTIAPTLIALANGVPPPSAPVVTDALNLQVTDSYAAFAQGSYDLTSKLTGELGVRYSYDRKDFDYQQLTSNPAATCPANPVPLSICPFGPFSGSDSWGALSGTASLSYHVTDTFMPFVRVSRGYKSGGWNGVQNPQGGKPDVPYDPEYLINYEVGLKYETPGRTLRFNVAAFDVDYTDLQLRFQDAVTFQQFTTNAGDARSRGMEMELNWLALDSLHIDLNAGTTRTKITRVIPSPALNGLRDKEFPFAPHTTAAATATYSLPMAAGLSGMFSVTGQYRSDMWLDNSNSVNSRGSTLVNARVGLEQDDGKWGVYLSGQNLTDVNRLAFFVGSSPVSGQIGFPNAPRTWQIELRGRF